MDENLREIYLNSDSFELQFEKNYTVDEITKICSDLVKLAEHRGLQNCFISFNSTMDSYDNVTGPVEIIAGGYRLPTKDEMEAEKSENEIYSLADEWGLTYYETATILKLKERKKISIHET